jgi:predicted AlkP superfamily phosphohydrolase/phosphomutase
LVCAYQFLDAKIGQLLAVLPKDSLVLVVSDHGAKAMAGGVCINDWLRQEGYLKLKSEPKESQKLDLALVDWQQTVAWGEGGYYSRIFLNVKDREPEGLVAPSNYQEVRLELKEKLEEMLDHQGQPLNNKVLLPEEIYKATKNIPPDLMVYFGDLNWRSVGTVGNSSIYVFENDTGPDDANHDYWGIFIASYLDGRKLPWQQKEYYSIYDVMPLLTKTVYSVASDLTSDISC